MAGFGRLWIAIAISSAVAPHGATATASSSLEKKAGTAKQLVSAFEEKDCPKVVRLGRSLLDARGGSGLSGEIEALLYDMVVTCELQQEAKDAAYLHAVKGTALESSSDWLWHVRLGLELDTKRSDAVIA